MKIGKIFGILSCVFLSIANLMNLHWTYYFVEEQIRTGWGYSTELGLGIIVVIIFEFISLVPLLLGLIAFLVQVIKKNRKVLMYTNIGQTVFFLVQLALAHVFMGN